MTVGTAASAPHKLTEAAVTIVLVDSMTRLTDVAFAADAEYPLLVGCIRRSVVDIGDLFVAVYLKS